MIEKLHSDLWHYFSGLSSKIALTKAAIIDYYSNILAHKNLTNLRTASNCGGSSKGEKVLMGSSMANEERCLDNESLFEILGT